MALVASIRRARTGAGVVSFLLILATALVAGCSQPQTPPPADQPAEATVEPQGPRCVIVMIGDGMGFEQVKAASLYAYGREGALAMQQMPHQGEMTTYPAPGPDHVTGSAAAGTALATGRKANNGVVSLAIPGDGQPLTTALELHARWGHMTGLVSTTTMCHATPAAFGAHAPKRSMYNEIAECYLNDTRPNVLFGGVSGTRDGKPVGMAVDKARAAGYTVLRDRLDLLNAPVRPDVHFSGQFGRGHMPYMYDLFAGTAAGAERLPTLSEMTAKALAVLSTDPDGLFLMVEGGRIDHAGHGNHLERNIFETLEFDRAVETVLRWADGRDDVLVIVTADHECGGLTVTADRGIGRMPEVTWSTKGHTGVPVPIFAQGPGAEAVVGTLDNTDVFRLTVGKRPATTPGLVAEPLGAAAD
ncbi:MAG: alkaline phosphatase [Planctomycetota bacterium]